jgi:hypothetical protein
MSITQELKYPLQDLMQFFKGILLSIIYFLILPLAIIFGYQIKIMNHIINGKRLPKLNHYKKLIKIGFKSIIIHLTYLIPYIIIYSASMLAVQSNLVNLEGAQRSAYLSKLNEFYYTSPNYYLGQVLYYAGLFFLPAGLLLFASNYKMKNALKFSKVIMIIKKNVPKYALTFIIIMVITRLLSQGLSIINLSLLFPALNYYLLMVYAVIYGNIYKRINEYQSISE